jgi:hypothetical protein
MKEITHMHTTTTTLRLTCPCCARTLRAPAMDHATQVIKRTCACGNQWQITITPLRNDEATRMDRLAWLPLGRVATSRAERRHAARMARKAQTTSTHDIATCTDQHCALCVDPPTECADCERSYGPGTDCRCHDEAHDDNDEAQHLRDRASYHLSNTQHATEAECDDTDAALALLAFEPCTQCGQLAPVLPRPDDPDYHETVCSCTTVHLGQCDMCGVQLVPTDESGKRCAPCADALYEATGQAS